MPGCKAFKLATGTAFWLGICAVVAAFLLLLPLHETVLSTERLAEIRGRRVAGTTSADGSATSGSAAPA